jgi:phosphate transport system substrate-binding protein
MIARFGPLTIAPLALALLLTGCGGPSGSTDAGAREEAVVIDGSSTVYRISQAAQIGYKKSHGDAQRILVGRKGTGGGFSRYLQGEIDIIDASRPAKPEEESQAQAKGLEWTRFLVGYDGITVVTNPKNDFAKVLTVEQLKHLFEPASKVKTWKDLDPAWPSRPIILYTPDNDSGTWEFFTEAIVGKKEQRKDVQASPDDNVLVTGVASDEDGLGYFGYAYYSSRKEQLRAVAVQNGPDATPVLPDAVTILDKTYAPLSRPLYIYVKNRSLTRPGLLEFLTYYLDNIEQLATSAGYVPPRAEDLEANRQALEAARKAGTSPAAESVPTTS